MAPNAPRTVDWASLKAFIAEREAYEEVYDRPAPLTDAEFNAITTLIPPPPAPADGCNFATIEGNWVGKLNEYLQRHHPSFTLDFAEEAVLVANTAGKGCTVQWRCVCTLPGHHGTFPRAGFGLDADSTPGPAFAKKQEAKKYAAKAAYSYLQDRRSSKSRQAYMVNSGAILPQTTQRQMSESIQQASPAAPEAVQGAKRKASVGEPIENPINKTTKAPSTEAARSVIRTAENDRQPSLPHLGPAAPLDIDAFVTAKPNPSVFDQLQILSKELWLPLPRIDAEPVDGLSDIYNARPNFENHPLGPHEDVGVVKGVFTKKAAREKSAELVVAWMESVRASREAQADDFMKENGIRNKLPQA